jgi:hypothetical protein
MSRELTQNERRLSVLGAIGLLWGALLVAIGFTVPFVAIVIGGLLLIAVVGLQGRVLADAVKPRLGRVGGRVVGASQDASRKIGDVNWSAKGDSARRRGAAARRTAADGMKRVFAAGGAAVTGVESRGRELAARRAARPAPPTRREAVEAGEQALAIFKTLGDSHGAALTLNGLGLTQARMGDEAGALDSYEAAVALLTEIGDSHGAGRVLANLGALHRGQGHDAQARAAWSDALERLEPGTPEHERMAQQLRIAS